MKDTNKKVEQLYHKMLMAKSGAERMKMGVSMFETAKKFVEASLPKGLSIEEKRKAMLKRTYPDIGKLVLYMEEESFHRDENSEM